MGGLLGQAGIRRWVGMTTTRKTPKTYNSTFTQMYVSSMDLDLRSIEWNRTWTWGNILFSTRDLRFGTRLFSTGTHLSVDFDFLFEWTQNFFFLIRQCFDWTLFFRIPWILSNCLLNLMLCFSNKFLWKSIFYWFVSLNKIGTLILFPKSSLTSLFYNFLSTEFELSKIHWDRITLIISSCL